MVDPRQHPVACRMRLGGLSGSVSEVIAVPYLVFVAKNWLCWIGRGALVSFGGTCKKIICMCIIRFQRGLVGATKQRLCGGDDSGDGAEVMTQIPPGPKKLR